MSDTATQDGHSAYYRAVTAEDDRLVAALHAIRADQESGHLSVREAADNRVNVLQAHLDRCAALRMKYLGD